MSSALPQAEALQPAGFMSTRPELRWLLVAWDEHGYTDVVGLYRTRREALEAKERFDIKYPRHMSTVWGVHEGDTF